MQPELLITVLILCFIGWSIAVYIGYRIGQKNKDGWLKIDNIEGNTITLKKPLQEAHGTEDKITYKANPNAEKLSQKDDIINHEGVGIVYRPTEQEINKMNEPESERQAKEAIAETIRNTPAPEI